MFAPDFFNSSAESAGNGYKTSLAFWVAALSCCCGALWATASQAQEPGMAAPRLVLRDNVQLMPKSETQKVRVLTAVFNPGDSTVFTATARRLRCTSSKVNSTWSLRAGRLSR